MAEVLVFLGVAWVGGAVVIGGTKAIFLLEAQPDTHDVVDSAVYAVFWPIFCVIRGWQLVLKEIKR